MGVASGVGGGRCEGSPLEGRHRSWTAGVVWLPPASPLWQESGPRLPAMVWAGRLWMIHLTLGWESGPRLPAMVWAGLVSSIKCPGLVHQMSRSGPSTVLVWSIKCLGLVHQMSWPSDVLVWSIKCAWASHLGPEPKMAGPRLPAMVWTGLGWPANLLGRPGLALQVRETSNPRRRVALHCVTYIAVRQPIGGVGGCCVWRGGR